MAILSGFQTLTSSTTITCSESPLFTRFDRKLTFNFLRKSYEPIRIDSGSFRLDHPAIGKLYAAKENSVMGNLLDEEPACVNDDSRKTAIKDEGLASGSEAMKKHVDKRPSYINDDVTKAVPEYIDAGHASGSEVKATSQHLRMSVPKVQRVIDQIRGRSYEEALMVLELMPYRACMPILKLIYSAAANARHNMGLNETDLFISKVEVNGGPTIKRSRPRARGQSYPIRKPTCHITVVLKDRSKLF